MNNKEKKQKLVDFSEYLDGGIMEVGKDNGLNVDVTNIVKLKQGKMPDSVFMLQAFAQKLSYRDNYSVATFRVLFYFISLSQYENFVSVDIKTISDCLDISELSVKRATKTLVQDNVVIKVPHPSDKRRVDYFLNPLGMWKGKTLSRDKFLNKAKQEKIQLDMFNEE
jgi:DNA-binding MarR family transcriptional regulator